MLYIFTLIVNLVALAVSVWLGLYIINHSPRNKIAWLTGLTLMSIASYFYNFLLALDPPTSPNLLPLWMQPFLALWPDGAFEHGWSNWLKGWQIMPALATWHHISLLLRPDEMNAWRRIRVLIGYLVAISAIYLNRNTSLIFSSETMRGDVLFLTTLTPGPLYPVFIGFLFLFFVLSTINLIRSAKGAKSKIQKKQLELMATATVISGMIVPIGIIAIAFNILLPRATLVLLLGTTVFMIGYGVARYSAFIEGRAVVRDFFYNFVAMLVLAGLYLFVAWSSVVAYKVPIAIIATMMVVAIFTHSLTRITYRLFDLLFYQGKSRNLRERLQNLVYKVYQLDSLEEYISPALEALCNLVGATYGVILLIRKDELEILTTYRWARTPVTIPVKSVEADDVIHLSPDKPLPPFDEAALLIPLYTTEKQIGALLLGRPENSTAFSQPDVEQILDVSDRFADAIRNAERENERVLHFIKESESHLAKPDLTHDVHINMVEDALRNLFDYAHLADTPLSETKLVHAKLAGEKKTYIERGKAVQVVVVEALNQMRPNAEIPRDPPPREWYPYIILHDAYIKGIQNRDIMKKLYISEGTFNRTRRGAIRSLARAIEEMQRTG